MKVKVCVFVLGRVWSEECGVGFGGWRVAEGTRVFV